MGKVIGITQSYSGDLVQFSTVKGGDITSLNVPISPEQDLHGYASPWGPGGGKNIANYADCVTQNRSSAEVTILDSQNGFNVKTITTGTYRSGQIANMTFEAGVTYTLSADVEITSGTAAFGFRKKSASALVATTSSITTDGHYSVSYTVTEETASDLRLSFFATYITSEDGDVTFSNVMLEVGSTATSFAPYENVCPISGRTNLSAYRTGKNLCKIGVINGRVSNGITYTENADGSVHCKGTASAESFSAGGVAYSSRDERCMYVLPAGTYTVSNISGARIYVNYYNSELVSFGNATYVQAGNSVTKTFNESVIIYIRISVSSGTSVDTDSYVMVTEGSIAATVYEPWQMQIVTVNWYTQVGDVYGGTLDFGSGVLMVDMANIPSYNGETINEPWMSSMDSYAAGTPPTIGAQVVYPLADPIKYQLSASQISALTGYNTVWASNGENITLSVLVTATGFNGWLIKAVTNGVGVEIPLKYMRAETYSVTPDQRMEWSAERDVTGVLHRETVQNLPPKIEFNTPLMANSDINALNSIIRAAFTNELQRNITIQFYDPERDEYWEWDCYMPDVKYQIRNVDAANHIINYEETRYAFIGY